MGAAQCGAWVWVEEDSLAHVRQITQGLLRIRETLFSGERVDTKGENLESESNLKISISKQFICFVSKKRGSRWNMPDELRRGFREVRIVGASYVDLIQSRLELFGIENERQTIARVVGTLSKSAKGLAELVLAMNSIFGELEQFRQTPTEENMQMLSIQSKIKFKKLFLDRFSKFAKISKMESKINVSKFSIQKETQVSLQRIDQGLNSLASVQMAQKIQRSLHEKIFHCLTGRALNEQMSQNISTLRRILEQKGKVVLLGPTNSGKSFAVETLRVCYETLHAIIRQGLENSSLQSALFNPLLKTITSSRVQSVVNCRRVHVNNSPPTFEFQNNRSISVVERAWLDLKNGDPKKGLLKWLLVDGQLSAYDQSFLEEIEDLNTTCNLMHLSQSEQGFPAKFRTSSAGIQVLLETDDVSRYSPRFCIEYPIIIFGTSKDQLLDLFVRHLRLPEDDFIFQEICDFLKFICIPFFKQSKAVSQSSVSRDKNKKFKLTKTTKRFNMRTKTKLQSIMSSKDTGNHLRTGLFESSLFQDLRIWGILVNTANIFGGFLKTLKEKIKLMLSEQMKRSDNKAAEMKGDARELVHRNLVKVLCVFSLFSAKMLKKDKINRIEKLLKKIAKVHFIKSNKKRKEKLRKQRERGNYFWSAGTEKAVELPSQSLSQVFPTLLVTALNKITLEYKSFDDNVDLLKLTSSIETGSGRSTSSRYGSLRLFGSNLVMSKNSLQNDSLLASAQLSMQSQVPLTETIFLENGQTWILKQYLRVLQKSHLLKIIYGQKRSGKLTTLENFLDNQTPKVKIRIDDLVVKLGLWNTIGRFRQSSQKGPLHVILDNVFLASTQIAEKLEAKVQHLDSSSLRRCFGVELAQAETPSQFDLWGTSSVTTETLHSARVRGKACAILAQNFDEKELKKVFQVYFFKLLGNYPLIFNLKDKIIKGVAVILDSLCEHSGGNLSLSRGVALIRRVVHNLRNLFASTTVDHGQQSFFRQETVIKVLLWELSQDIFCHSDRTLPSADEHFWADRAEVINKSLKLSFRKKMSINLDLVCRNHFMRTQVPLGVAPSPEHIKLTRVKDKVHIEDSVAKLRKFLSHEVSSDLKWFNIDDDFCLGRLIEFEHRLRLGRVVLFEGNSVHAREMLQLVCLLDKPGSLQVYETDQVFSGQKRDLELLSQKACQPESVRLAKDFPFIESNRKEDLLEKITKNSFYTNNSEESFVNSEIESELPRPDQQADFEEFLINLAKEVLTTEQRIVILIREEHLSVKAKQLVRVLLDWGDLFFSRSGKQELVQSVLSEFRQKCRKNMESLTTAEFYQKIRETLQTSFRFVICVDQVAPAQEEKPIPRASRDNIRNLLDYFGRRTEVFLEVPLKEDHSRTLLAVELESVESFLYDDFEFQNFWKVFERVTNNFGKLLYSRYIRFVSAFCKCFRYKRHELDKKYLEVRNLIDLRNKLETNAKEKRNQTGDKGSEERQKGLTQSTVNTQSHLILMDQILRALKELPSLDIREAQLDKRRTQINVMTESLVLCLVGWFPQRFRRVPDDLNSLMKMLKKEKMLTNNSLATIVDYPFKDFDSDPRNVINYAQLRLSSILGSPGLLLVGDDPLFVSMVQSLEPSRKLIESKETDSDLEDKVASTVRFGQALLMSMATSSVPNILEPAIYGDLEDQHGQLSVRVGDKWVGYSHKSQLFFALRYKHLVRPRFLRAWARKTFTVVDFFPVSVREVYFDLYFRFVYAQRPEMRVFKKKHTQKFVEILKLIGAKRAYLHKFLANVSKQSAPFKAQNAYFFVELETILADLQDLALKKSNLVKLIQKVSLSNPFFELASRIFFRLCSLGCSSHLMPVSFDSFCRFLLLVKKKPTNFGQKPLALDVVEEPVPPDQKALLQYYFHQVQCLAPLHRKRTMILGFVNRLHLQFLDHEAIMFPLLQKDCDFFTVENKLKWAIDQLTPINKEFNSFANYLSSNLSVSSLDQFDSPDFMGKLYADFLASFTRSTETQSKTVTSASNSAGYSELELHKNLDSIKLFLLRLFDFDQFIAQSEQYCLKVLSALHVVPPSPLMTALPLSSYPQLLSSSLKSSDSGLVFVYGDPSNQINLDICLNFSRRANSKLEWLRVFRPTPIFISDSLSGAKKLKASTTKLDKLVKTKTDNVIRHAMMESRPSFLDLRHLPDDQISDFLEGLSSVSGELALPVFVGVRSPDLVPLFLRSRSLQVQLDFSRDLRPILESVFSLNVFLKDSFYDFLEPLKNKLLKITSFYSVFAFGVIFMRRYLGCMISGSKLPQFPLLEASLFLSDLKMICDGEFHLEFLTRRLKNCRFMRNINPKQLEEVLELVFNCSFRSFVNRIKSKQIDFGKSPGNCRSYFAFAQNVFGT